jgi:hypothetical protein
MNDSPVRDAQAEVMRSLLNVVNENKAKLGYNPFLPDTASYDHLVWMLENGIERNYEVPVDKTGRWIGFVQGVLICRGVMDTNDERDRTRSLFHEAYRATGQDIPPTINRT